MKRTLGALCCVLLTVFCISSCKHEHTFVSATCTAPQICSDCNQTEGEALGHKYSEATCTAPKTCSVCNQTEGETLGHTYIDATCTTPKTCSVCGETEGEPIEHTWEEATCKSPEKCNVCGEIRGEKLEHKFVYGICKVCGEEDPDYGYELKVWIPTNGGTKYHSRSNCSNMDNPKEVTISEAKSRGFSPCQRCQ